MCPHCRGSLKFIPKIRLIFNQPAELRCVQCGRIYDLDGSPIRRDPVQKERSRENRGARLPYGKSEEAAGDGDEEGPPSEITAGLF